MHISTLIRNHIGVKFSHTGSLVPWKVKHKLSVTEPDSEISYAYKKKITCNNLKHLAHKQKEKYVICVMKG